MRGPKPSNQIVYIVFITKMLSSRKVLRSDHPVVCHPILNRWLGQWMIGSEVEHLLWLSYSGSRGRGWLTRFPSLIRVKPHYV